jgi:hypothetical protein
MEMNSATSPCGPANPFAKGPKDSKYVENIMEHAFLSEVLQHCWFIRHHPVEVIRPDVDAGGYDLVLEANERVRHVQLKTYSAGGAKGAPKLINSRLREHRDAGGASGSTGRSALRSIRRLALFQALPRQSLSSRRMQRETSNPGC